MDAVDAETRRRGGVDGDVIDEYRGFGGDTVAIEKDLEDARVGLDEPDFAGDDDVRRTRTGMESARVAGEKSRRTSWRRRRAERFAP